ncbi:MAG: potassium-transporting ATPase subunit KdpA [Deltaproteobacteria bacterium]|nr:potassium-transporting ATPase subunit KdpA [Deltaproteobacteria bacterium]
MTVNGFLQVGMYVVVLLALAKPLGGFMARVYDGKSTWLSPVLRPLERLIYRVCGVDPDEGMTWKTYAVSMLLFNFLGLLVVYGLQRLQGILPLNPQGFAAVTPDSSFNTAASFATNTNWQGYVGEATMSYATQMLGLAVQNFVSAATGMAVLVALIRGFREAGSRTVGNFWVTLTRSTLYILLPLAIGLALVQTSQGVVQNFSAYRTVPLLQATSVTTPVKNADGNPVLDEKGEPKTETTAVTEQTLPMGPASSQIAIKQLGTNGGGFFNVNSAHPYENSTPLSNFFEVLALLLIGAALCYTFGQMVGDTRQGWAVLAAMTVIFVAMLALCEWAEYRGNPRHAAAGADIVASDVHPGGNMEGKEVRFGIANSALWATATTAASNGAVNAMHDSFTPLGGLVPLFMMQLGEVVYGGVGSGLYGMLVFAIIAVFVAGLMVGRTPEYLGKKIEAYEMKMAAIVILIPPIVVLGFTALAVVTDAGLASRFNKGAHGFSEILYAFSSMGNNNGSAFAGLSANVPFYNATGGLAMLMARYWLAIPTLAIAGSLAQKKHVPAGAGTLPTHTPLFVCMLIGVVIIVGVLTFVPALALGPIVEHLMLSQ